MRTIVYVDGFNLYYRLLKARPALKWVNVYELARSILDPRNHIIKLRYFTAHVSGRLDPDAPHRQQLYLDALSSISQIELHFGSFLEVRKYAGLVKPTLVRARDNQIPFRPWPDVAYVWKTEEKGSDVNLASYLLLDAFQESYEVAAVLSNDSDLTEPIRMVTQVLGKPVGLLSPVRNPTPQLRNVASFLRHVVPSDLPPAQFPDLVTLSDGRTVKRPPTWS
jgi:NYN domain